MNAAGPWASLGVDHPPPAGPTHLIAGPNGEEIFCRAPRPEDQDFLCDYLVGLLNGVLDEPRLSSPARLAAIAGPVGVEVRDIGAASMPKGDAYCHNEADTKPRLDGTDLPAPGSTGMPE